MADLSEIKKLRGDLVTASSEIQTLLAAIEIYVMKSRESRERLEVKDAIIRQHEATIRQHEATLKWLRSEHVNLKVSHHLVTRGCQFKIKEHSRIFQELKNCFKRQLEIRCNRYAQYLMGKEKERVNRKMRRATL